MRTILRTILAVVLLLGSGAAGWVPVSSQAHESCCCGTPAGTEDRCPCPKPEGNRTPSNNSCPSRAASVASLAFRRTQAERRTEARPEPASWAQASQASIVQGLSGSPAPARGRDPDLGRHLARLNTFRI